MPNSDANMAETTPDTSFASVDENDLTEEYDKYGVSNHLLNSSLDGEVSVPSHFPLVRMDDLSFLCSLSSHLYL